MNGFGFSEVINRYNCLDQWKLKVKRGNVPWLRWLPGFYRLNLPFPAHLKPMLRLFYSLHFSVLVLVRRFLVLFYKEPLFRSRCTALVRTYSCIGKCRT